MEERRKHKRILYQETVMIKFFWVTDHPELSGQVMKCKTEDVSFGGIRFHCPSNLEPETQMHLAVIMTQPRGAYTMEATARWSQPASGDDGYIVGVKFNDTEGDLPRWCDFVEALQASL